ncbi:MAG: DUF1015 domain-containing protein [Candidatus Omnitrophota bacterium]
MPQIKPFRALMYNQEKIRDLSRVACPPYDIISPVDSNYYHDSSPYNFIHLELGKKVPGEDKYKRAKNYLKDWLKDRILIKDEEPCIYFYSQQYSLRGVKRERLGFISLLHLGDKKPSIYSHEHTRLEPKEDRLRLIKKVKANLSPIFLIFPDNKRIVQRTYQHHIQEKSLLMEITDKEKVTHKLWRIDAPEVLAYMQAGMQKENIFIADGHHRYEVAATYRDLMKKKLGEAFTGQESFNYVLAYFTNAPSHDLCVLPVHRLVKTKAKFDYKSFIMKLKDYFYVEEKVSRDKAQFFFLMEKGGRTEHVLGMYKDSKFHLLRLKNIRILDKMMNGKSKEYRSLDVSILNNLILKNILKLDIEDKRNIVYSPYADEFIDKVDRSNMHIAFILNPAKISEIISVALNAERMPSKTTYFYPKVLSGLVMHKFD